MKKLLITNDFFTNEEIRKKYEYFRNKYKFDGFEFIKFNENSNEDIKKLIVGYHMRFFPMWIDMYLENFEVIESELQEEQYKFMLGGNTKDEMLDYYKKELEIAHSLEVEYIVIHACNIRITEAFSFEFKNNDFKILEKVAEILNKLIKPKYKFKILFENLWWPGLKLLSKEEIEFLLDKINFKNIGFMLDTGHMLNTNIELKSSDDGVKYIKEKIDSLGEYKNLIKGIHLNYSLSGKYIKKAKVGLGEKEIYNHISKIDYHDPFENKKIKEIIDSLNIDFLVYELIGMNDTELEEKIVKQEKALI